MGQRFRDDSVQVVSVADTVGAIGHVDRVGKSGEEKAGMLRRAIVENVSDILRCSSVRFVSTYL